MDLPLISIVLSTFNGEQFLETQIASLLKQTYPNLEIVITDDASTDRTPEILRQYLADTRFRIFLHSENVGFIKNFERGMLLARGDFITLCDQDDIWLPEKTEKLYRHIDGYSLAYCDSELIDENGQSLGKKVSDIKNMYTGRDARGFLFSNVVSGHALMLKKEVLPHAFPLPPEAFHDEWLAIHATMLEGIVYVDEPLALYRQHTKNVTQIVMPKRVAPRTLNRRYEALLKKLAWIGLLAGIQKKEQKPFYDQLYRLFERKKKGRFVWPLFFFLLAHQRVLFRHMKKSFASKVVEIRKLARGEQEKFEPAGGAAG